MNVASDYETSIQMFTMEKKIASCTHQWLIYKEMWMFLSFSINWSQLCEMAAMTGMQVVWLSP